MLKADVILVSDTSMIAPEIPSVTVGLRGLSYIEVSVTGPNKDLHSGLFGGAVANPANVLAKLIADLIDENGHVTVPGFYDDVLEISQEERAAMAKAPFNEEEYKKALDIEEVSGEKGYTTLERTGIRPSLDVNGMWSGYTGEGAKTVLPSTAHAKISMRLVPNQNWEKIGQLVADALKARAPKSVKVEVKLLHGGSAYGADLASDAYKAAEQAYMDVYGKLPHHRHLRASPRHQVPPDGIRPRSRRDSFPQRKLPPAELLPRHRNHRHFLPALRQVVFRDFFSNPSGRTHRRRSNTLRRLQERPSWWLDSLFCLFRRCAKELIPLAHRFFVVFLQVCRGWSGNGVKIACEGMYF